MAAFVVNPGGATHSVPAERAEALLSEGFRPASPAEILAWHVAQGLELAAELADEFARGLEGAAAAVESHAHPEVTDAPVEHGEPDHAAPPARRRSRRR